MVKITYYISPIEQEEFSAKEMARMGVFPIKSLKQLPEAFETLGVEDFDPATPIENYGYIVSMIGTVSKPAWVVYSDNLDLEYALGVMTCTDFYDLYEESPNGDTLVFRNIRIRKEYVEEDMAYYIELHLETRTPNGSNSEFLN